MSDDDWAERIHREDERMAQECELIREALESGDAWGAVERGLSMGLSGDVPRLLAELWSECRIDIAKLRAAVPEVWIHNKSPVSSIGQRRWLAMFKAAGFLSQTKETQVHHPDGSVTAVEPLFEITLHTGQPTGPLTVWRGASLESGGRGMSWSEYRECAAKFAGDPADLGIESGIFEATIPGRAVLAIFGDHREQEIVVNPYMLRGRIRLVERVAARPPRFSRHWSPGGEQ
jgi:hypothetical protein